MIRIIKNIFVLITSLFRSRYMTVYMNDDPFIVASNTLYVIGERDFRAYAIMLCPCGCKRKVYLNLLSSSKPAWKILNDKRVPTITPSVWNTSNCRSHYFIRSGKVVWANENAMR